jgi:hypothetical protein
VRGTISLPRTLFGTFAPAFVGFQFNGRAE